MHRLNIFLPLSLVMSSSAFVVFHQKPSFGSFSAASGDETDIRSLDVSDLGLTMDDLNAPLPQELLEGMVSGGFESTNRIPSVIDEGCEWLETADELQVKLSIPGLRGQPAAAMAVLFSTTTISVSVFGRVVWSAILRGTIDSDKCSFETEDGMDFIPIIRMSVQKDQTENSRRWGGFILQVGEDSLI